MFSGRLLKYQIVPELAQQISGAFQCKPLINQSALWFTNCNGIWSFPLTTWHKSGNFQMWFTTCWIQYWTPRQVQHCTVMYSCYCLHGVIQFGLVDRLTFLGTQLDFQEDGGFIKYWTRELTHQEDPGSNGLEHGADVHIICLSTVKQCMLRIAL